MMIRSCLSLVMLVLVSSLGSAQTALQVPLPAGFPVTAEEVFAVREAVAVTDGVAVYVVNGLPDPSGASVQVVTPLAGLAMSGPWTRLGESVAAYRSQAGELVLVRDLPAAPVFQATGLVVADAAFIPVNESTAVRIDTPGQQFLVLRHDAATASLAAVPVPAPHVLSPFAGARSRDDLFLAAGGADQRTLIKLQNLDDVPSNFAVTITQFPPGPAFDGVLVTESGSFVGWVQGVGGNWAIEVHRFGVGPAIYSYVPTPFEAPGFAFTLEVSPGRGDAIIARLHDGFFAASEYVMIEGIDLSPYVTDFWVDGVFGDERATNVASDELVFWRAIPPAAPMTLHRYAPGGVTTTSFTIPGVGRHFVRPHPASLVAITELGTTWFASVISDLWGAATPLSFPLAGAVTAAPFNLGPGLVGVFHQDPGAPSVTATLTLVTAPGSYEEAASPAPHPPWVAFHLEPTPRVPRLGAPFTLQLWSTANDPAEMDWLVVADAIDEPMVLGPPFAPPATLVIRPTAVLGVLPVTLTAGYGSVSLGFETAPLDLVGRRFWFQGVRLTGGTFGLSNTVAVIPG